VGLRGFGSGGTVTDARKRLEETRASLAASETLLARVPTDRDEIAAREHAGEITAEQSAQEFENVDVIQKRHRSEVGRLSRICQLIEGEIAKIENDAALAAHAEAVDQVRAAQATALAASTIVGKQAAQLIASIEKLERARASAEAAVAVADELYVESADELPVVDEPGWVDDGDVEHLFEFLKAGPLQPIASGVAASERAARQRKADDDQMILQAINGLAGLSGLGDPRTELERGLPPRLHEEGWARALKVNAQRRAESDARKQHDRERELAPQRVLP